MKGPDGSELFYIVDADACAHGYRITRGHCRSGMAAAHLPFKTLVTIEAMRGTRQGRILTLAEETLKFIEEHL